MNRRVIPSPRYPLASDDRFERIFSEHYRKVYSLALRMTGSREDAADATQEAFIRVHKGLAGFREDSSISTWIYSIAANVCRTALKKRRPSTMQQELDEDVADPCPDFAKRVADRDALERGLLLVPEDLRICVLLSDLAGFSYEEISEALSIPLGTVKSRVFRARKKLIHVLKGQSAENAQGRGTGTHETRSK